MPRVKIDYVVSFSSEDSENQASNLLAWDVSKKKWLCNKGELSCSVVLQLVKAAKISALQIGAYHSAIVEVLVGRSETPNEPFQVLVPSSVFMSPAESRRGECAERVRSFSASQLAGARDAHWDRIRVICSQPYNRQCRYGLSFVHIFEPDDNERNDAPAPAPRWPLALRTHSSDEDDFKPGELFAKHLRKPTDDEPANNTDTGAQIRQATSQALRNIAHSATKLVKTTISTANAARPGRVNDDTSADRQRDNLMYTDDDEQPNDKIDKIVQRHNDEKIESKTTRKVQEKDKAKGDKSKNTPQKDRDLSKTPSSSNKDRDGSNRQHTGRDTSTRKRPHTDDKRTKDNGSRPKAGAMSSEPHTLLRGVVFAMSGYENPRRARVRTAALAMGARYERDWTPKCTHLICAFPNTPKLRTVRASTNDARCCVVTADWIEECCARRRLLPWQWFATEDKYKVKPTAEEMSGDDECGGRHDSEFDTDDEIEKVLRKQKQLKNDKSPTRRGNTTDTNANSSTESDVAFIRDERIKANITIEDSDNDSTDIELRSEHLEKIDENKSLPDFFDGYTFVIEDDVENKGFNKELLRRYVVAYGGVVIDLSQMDDYTNVDYILCARAGRERGHAQPVRADWVWRCHSDRALSDHAEYAL